MQETAQLLTGPSLPETMLEALFSNAEVGEVVGLINLSPYDAWVEKTCLQYHIQKGGRKLRSLTCATDVDLVDYSQKLCAMLLMEERQDETRYLSVRVTKLKTVPSSL